MKKSILLIFVGIFILFIVLYYYFNINNTSDIAPSSSNMQTIKVNSDPSSLLTNKTSFSAGYDIDSNTKSPQKLPLEFSICQSEIDLNTCLLYKDNSEQFSEKDYINNENLLVSKLDKLNTVIEFLPIPQINFETELSFQIQQLYIDVNIDFIYNQHKCNTDFCNNILVSAKKGIVERYISRGIITSQKSCNALDNKELINYCLQIIN